MEGNSDELDEPIKAVFADVPFAKEHNLMSLNSINWSRILVQMAHHFFAYFQCAASLDTHTLPTVEVVVPTGAAGNVAGKQIGAFPEKHLLPSSCPLAAVGKGSFAGRLHPLTSWGNILGSWLQSEVTD